MLSRLFSENLQEKEMSFTRLDLQKIEVTCHKLCNRIGERFPESGLFRISQELLLITQQTENNIRNIVKPIWWLRFFSYTCLLIFLTILGYGMFLIINNFTLGIDNITELMQGVESGTNELIFIGIVAYFLFNLEGKFKQNLAIKSLHQFRSLAHVVDMHQLTKDPSVLMNNNKTISSPERSFTKFEMVRYLDYCSEILALVGKLSVVYAQNLNDERVLNNVNDIENITQNLSSKIWQKIMILDLS
jgi:hypothetical protein